MVDLYQELLLEHNSRPRNFRKSDRANRTAEGSNPLCGDRVTLYLELEGGVIEDISFQGKGCAIARASISMMTEAVSGKGLAETQRLAELFLRQLTGEEADCEELGELEVFRAIRFYPSRIKCATLGWQTLRAALEGKCATVSTE